MKILKATSYTMGVPLSISTYLGPQLVEHIRLSLIIESKSKQFQSRSKGGESVGNGGRGSIGVGCWWRSISTDQVCCC
jgi:hypothetical protein